MGIINLIIVVGLLKVSKLIIEENNMSKKLEIYRHGELILKGIEKLPDGAKLIETTNRKILAFSETHHHHVLESVDKYKIYSWNGETYIELGSVGTLLHEKTGVDVHAPHKILPSIYKINIKKSYDYFLKKLARVID